jgi:hypothetical protein
MIEREDVADATHCIASFGMPKTTLLASSWA